MIALPVISDEARDSLDTHVQVLNRLTPDEAREIKRIALFADTFGAMDRVGLQRAIGQTDREAIRDQLSAALAGIGGAILQASNLCQEDKCALSVSLYDEGAGVFADPGVIEFPAVVPATGVERQVFKLALGLLSTLPYALPDLEVLISYWGWVEEDFDSLVAWLPTIYQQGDFNYAQMEKVIRQTARHSTLPEMESFLFDDDDSDVSRLAHEFVDWLECTAFGSFLQSAWATVEGRPAADLLTDMAGLIDRLDDADSVIFWAFFHDELSRFVAYCETHKAQVPAPANTIEFEDIQPLLSNVFIIPDTPGAYDYVDQFWEHYHQVGEAGMQVIPFDGEWADNVRLVVNLANAQPYFVSALASRMRRL